jgi:predicted peptidase
LHTAASELVHLEQGGHISVLAPEGIDSGVARALIVSLHYGGPVSPGYGGGLLHDVVAPALQALDAVMVAPDCGCDFWADAPCTDAISHAIDYALGRYCIDSNRIVLVGYSKGGIGTWSLANAHVPAFSAAIIMAGRPPETLDADAWNVPVYAIQAGEDELLPVTPTVDAIKKLQQHGVEATLSILSGVTHFETFRFVDPLRAAAPWLQRIWHQQGARCG